MNEQHNENASLLSRVRSFSRSLISTKHHQNLKEAFAKFAPISDLPTLGYLYNTDKAYYHNYCGLYQNHFKAVRVGSSPSCSNS
jgi:hypothetical protein